MELVRFTIRAEAMLTTINIRNVLMIMFACAGILFHTVGFSKSLNSAVRNEHVCRSGCMYL